MFAVISKTPVMSAIIKFLVLALTDLSMLPALTLMLENKRHFEVFIGTFQLIISFLFNFFESIGVSFFLEELEWHRLSDILTLTYAMLLCIHIMSISNEDVNIILRYAAFACCWLAKLKDQWDSTIFETIIVVIFVSGAVFRVVDSRFRLISRLHIGRPHYNWEFFVRALILLLAAALGFLIHQTVSFTGMLSHLLLGIVHICFGGSVYYFWKAVPLQIKKNDDFVLPTYF